MIISSRLTYQIEILNSGDPISPRVLVEISKKRRLAFLTTGITSSSIDHFSISSSYDLIVLINDSGIHHRKRIATSKGLKLSSLNELSFEGRRLTFIERLA